MTQEACGTLFVLQGFDAITQTVCVESRVRIADMDQLRAILAPESDGDPDLDGGYRGLSEPEMRQIGELCIPAIVPDVILTGICRPHIAFDTVPYLIHTTFELPLMLEGRKPLAVFHDAYPSEWFDEYLEPWEAFVTSGQIIRRIIDTPMPDFKQSRPDLDGMREVYFVLPGEEWRIDAYIQNIRKRTRNWDDDLERLEGSLLGYEDWQNDWWIQKRIRDRQNNQWSLY